VNPFDRATNLVVAHRPLMPGADHHHCSCCPDASERLGHREFMPRFGKREHKCSYTLKNVPPCGIFAACLVDLITTEMRAPHRETTSVIVTPMLAAAVKSLTELC